MQGKVARATGYNNRERSLKMNIIQEIEDMRQRMLREINTEFDRIIDTVLKSGDNITTQASAYSIKYPIMADPGIFKGKKPIAVVIDEEEFDVKTWKDVVKAVMNKCIESTDNIIRLYELAGKISGKKRVLLASSPDNMRSPIEITNRMYMETHYDTETLLNILINRILTPIGYKINDVYVIIRQGE